MKEKIVKRDEELVSNLVRRTNRIEGQIRGITKKITEDKYCE